MKRIFSNTMLPFAFMLILLAVSSSGIKASENVDIYMLIENATNAEDHNAIAEFYEKQALEAESKVEVHAKMAKTYDRSPKRKALAIHCKNLAQKYKETALEYRNLAGKHRKIAAELKN